jgi:hypothetical protein
MMVEEEVDCACAFCPLMEKTSEEEESASEYGSRFGWMFLRCCQETGIVCDEIL